MGGEPGRARKQGRQGGTPTPPTPPPPRFLTAKEMHELPQSPTRTSIAATRGLAYTGHPVELFVPSPPHGADGRWVATHYIGAGVYVEGRGGVYHRLDNGGLTDDCGDGAG